MEPDRRRHHHRMIAGDSPARSESRELVGAERRKRVQLELEQAVKQSSQSAALSLAAFLDPLKNTTQNDPRSPFTTECRPSSRP
jgi:hypothetical protein